MAPPTPTSIATVAYVVDDGPTVGVRLERPPPTTGQLWPRGNVS